jgi:hypothetical protein
MTTQTPKTNQPERLQETRLEQFAKALAEGNRKQAIRVTHKVVTDPSLRVLEGKRRTWELWHWQLTHPDPQHADREVLNMLIANHPSVKVWDEILHDYDDDVQRFGEPYYKAVLSGQLIRRVLQLRPAPAHKVKRSSIEKQPPKGTPPPAAPSTPETTPELPLFIDPESGAAPKRGRDAGRRPSRPSRIPASDALRRRSSVTNTRGSKPQIGVLSTKHRRVHA